MRESFEKITAVEGPQGKWSISTVRTYSGGSPNQSTIGNPFSSKDYADDTPWPYETMVFKDIGVTGYYHEPHRTQKEASAAHERILETIRAGKLEVGKGVRGPFGVPSMTADEWRESRRKVAA